MSFLGTGFGASGSYSITNSARFNGSGDYLSKTLTTSSTTSGSIWVKRSKLGATSPIFDNKVYFTSGDALYAFGLTSTALYRDPSAWYHVFWNGTGVYVNGTLVTGTGTYTAASVTNPRLGFDGTNYFSGYFSDFAFWNGTSASLQGGATDANGVWMAKRPSAGYSFLAFGSAGALGTDTSGNSNTWTVTGSPVQTTDTPTNNGCTWSPLDKDNGGSLTLANGNLAATADTTRGVRATMAVSSGKWYWEVKLSGYSGGSCMVGIRGVNSAWVVGNTIGAAAYTDGYAYYPGNGNKYNNGTSSAYGATFTNTDTIGFALDMDAGTITAYKNNVSQGTMFSGLSGIFSPAINPDATTTVTANFGQSSFAYTPPTGFKALCTANLPAVSIKKPSDHFNTVLAAGASIKSSSEALYTYFFEWIKDRANSNNHQLIDTVRGSSAVLQSNSTGAETTYSAPSGTSVGWVWNAGGAAVTNNAGSITSQVSVNTTAGMSVVTYTASGVAGTVGHGLGATPKLIIVKGRMAGVEWPVYHVAVGNAAAVMLNSSAAAASSAGYWNSTSPTSTVFSIGTSAYTSNGGSGYQYVAYCFAEIPGYSKFGSYVGNASADGPFVYCGFRPRYILTKCATGVGEWNVYDTARDTYNVCGDRLFPNAASAPNTLVAYDILSNGFKCRTNTGQDTNGSQTYIFAAFAEFPFGGSNVAPSPAR